jgi:hypothetical protein
VSFAFCGTALGITKAELITEIEARRTAIQDLDVRFVFYAVGQVPASAVQRDARRVFLKGTDRIRIDRTYRIGQTQYETSASLTGTRGWGYQAVNKQAYTRLGTDIPLIDTEGSGFFDVMMWYPCSVARGEGLNTNDLLSFLDSDDSVVLAQTEIINGHSCHVVQELDSNGQEVARVWIDPAWGYLPVKQNQFSTCTGSPPIPILVVLTITQASQVMAGVWLPTAGQRTTSAVPQVEELSNGLQYSMAVQQDASGLLLHVNQGVDDAVFDLSTKLPPTTMVADLDTGQFWVASARNYSAVADAALASLSDSTQLEPGAFNHAPRQRLISNLAWLTLMVSSGLSGAGLLFMRQSWPRH